MADETASGSWPWEETTNRRLRRIIDQYRTRLSEFAPAECAEIDDWMAQHGQRWVCSETIIDVNKLMSAQEIAEEFGLEPWNIHDWARRHPDRIPKHKDGRRTLYRVRDILEYEATN